MEAISTIATALQPTSLQTSLQKNSSEISIYNDQLTPEGIAKAWTTIKKSFPTLPATFYDVLTDRLKANNFTNRRLADAVNNVIDTCLYPQPTIAQFISYDRKVKLHTYEEMLRKSNESGHQIWNSYHMTRLPGRKKPVWIHVDDTKHLPQ